MGNRSVFPEATFIVAHSTLYAVLYLTLFAVREDYSGDGDAWSRKFFIWSFVGGGGC